MTRFAGVVASKPDAQLCADLGRLLSHFSSIKHGTEIKSGIGVAMGVVGGAECLIAERDHLIGYVDGCFFEVSGLPTRSGSDAKILLDLYERFGFRGALERINGDFAIALYDASKRCLWLGRDRVGVRPLYFSQGRDFFTWASQPGALLRHPGVSRRVNQRYVGLVAGSHYRTFDNDPSASPFANISQLPAGHLAELRFDAAVKIARYWELCETDDLCGADELLAEQYRELLLDSVKIRLKKASSAGFLLSGGMDSSSVLAAAVNITGERQQALSTVYSDPTYDESYEIRSMLENNVGDWLAVKIDTPDIFSVVDRMIRTHDEPVATATWLSHFILCEEASKRGFKSLFGGLGGDELNAGEYEHFFYHFADIKRTQDDEKLKNEIESWVSHHDHPIYKKSLKVVNDALSRVVNLRQPGRCLPDRLRIDRYAHLVNKEFFDVKNFRPNMVGPYSSYLKNRTFQDIFFETAPCCLRAEDRQTNAFGIQHFDPFFDFRLLEFMFRIPGRLKIRDGVTKVLLREATKGLLPEETRTRIKKTGWNAPAHIWFSGRSLANLRDLVSSRAFRERGIYRSAEVVRLIDDHERIIERQSVEENHMMFLWQLVNVELWHSYLDKCFSNN